ncbi:hypothetical protein ABZZ17_03765 [Streptomyces sp. NPDC006512]|uniref:hypothetical protein n=1 Tax=Streptomyces sp. NPDC006512 TaxID=3154307 RepID=UPI00339E0C15
MTESPELAAVLPWLPDRRRSGPQARASDGPAGAGAEAVRLVLAGEAPDEEVLRQLAATLGLHAVDLFVLAGLDVPDDMAPTDQAAAPFAPRIVMNAAHLPPADRRELLHLVRSLPREEPRSPFAPWEFAHIGDGPGGRLIRMFCHRNLRWSGLARVMAVLTPTYLSPSTYGVIGAGRKELTPRLVTDFAALLGIDAGELAVLTGVTLPEPPPRPAPEALDAAGLLWELRYLSEAQAEHVAALAESLRGDSCREYRLNLPAW